MSILSSLDLHLNLDGHRDREWKVAEGFED